MAHRRKRRTIQAACAALLLLPALAEAVPLDAPAPAFSVFSPDGEELTAAALRGKAYVLFYETRETVEQNRAFKTALGAWLRASEEARARTRVAGIVNAASANFVTRGTWKGRLREHARREGVALYADWSGRMAVDYALTPEASNVLVVDAVGVVRLARAGVLTAEDRQAALDLLRALAAETPPK